MSSSRGLSGALQFNYSLNPNINFYIYSGYSSWDFYRIFFYQEREGRDPQLFRLIGADEHSMIPVYLGSRINFHTIKLFTSFIELEIGYSHLQFNSYDIQKVLDSETGDVITYQSGQKTKVTDNLFGIGIGAGISHPITKNFNLILEFKLNSHFNSDYPGLFSTRGTYTRFMGGFSFGI